MNKGAYKSDTLSDPGTVVVKTLDAVVANGAMGGTWRTVQQTRVAKLNLNGVTVY